MKKKLGVVNIHSCVDIITNSSTELFCTVSGEKGVIEKAISSMMAEFGCTAVDFYVDEHEDYETCEIIEGRYDVGYQYETHHEPCGMIRQKLREILNIVEEHD